ncbi:hypothetical protein [Bartonella sp. HY406]|uniref:hypothetical protein n=1 Tax=Bartonella sp. HY406 TaxID=2979331 RepID=UPI0021C82462|nr:hypothetical protein [Bartonella sp. HY406]UXN04062.1 hypothetical protein N6B01_03235 [Bartonella sp. HY406]
MSRRPIILIVVGIIALINAFVFKPNVSEAPNDLRIACENKIRNMGTDGLDFIDRCKELTFATATTSTNAHAAAQAISSANKSDVLLDTVQKFLWGLGGILVFLGILMIFRRKRNNS